MINQKKVLESSVIGTTAMTLFSYLFSMSKKTNLKEPKLLGKMVRPLVPGMSKKQSRKAGWLAHYAVGLLFAETYAQIWERSSLKANAKNGLVFGGLSGIAAILIWKFAFMIHPDPPSVNFRKYAMNLLIAHVVFGLFAAIGYNSE
jgi:hypothetical protein